MRVVDRDQMYTLLKEMGVNLLSGEGCRLGMRWDTDVSPRIAPLISNFLGGMDFTQEGMNGWGLTPEGNYRPGYGSAYEYVEGKLRKKEGWAIDPGYCFKLPRALIQPLFIYLALRLGYAPGGITHIPAQKAGLQYNDNFILFESKREWEESRRDKEVYPWRQIDSLSLDYHYYPAYPHFENLHHFSGRTIK